MWPLHIGSRVQPQADWLQRSSTMLWAPSGTIKGFHCDHKKKKPKPLSITTSNIKPATHENLGYVGRGEYPLACDHW